MLVAREQFHLPYRVVRVVFLDIGKAGYRPALHQILTVAQPRIAQHRGAMAQGAGDLAGLVELDEFTVQIGRLLKGEHRPLPASDNDGVVGRNVDGRYFASVFNQRGKLRRREKTETDNVGI